MVLLRTWVKILLFLNSYTPLWLILFVKISIQNKFVSYQIIVGTVLIGTIALSLPILIKFSKKLRNIRILTIKEKNDISHAYLEYIITYIIPFIQQEYTSLEDAVPVLILMLVIMYIYIRSNLIYINPMLNLMGYNLFKFQDEHGNTYILLTKEKDILRNVKIKVVEFSENIVIGVE